MMVEWRLEQENKSTEMVQYIGKQKDEDWDRDMKMRTECKRTKTE